MKPWELARKIAYLCVDEFFAQGDLEKALGIAVQMLNDRDKVNRPNSQIGFIEFVVSPLIAAQVKLFPGLYEFGENISSNLKRWDQMWIDEYSPSQEDQDKVKARLAKVDDKMRDARYRGKPPTEPV